MTVEPYSQLGRRVFGLELDAVAPLPNQYCVDSRSKLRQHHSIAAHVFCIFWPHFCEVGGSGDTLLQSMNILQI